MSMHMSKREIGTVPRRAILDERVAKRKMLDLLQDIEKLNSELGRLSVTADRLDLYDLKKKIDSAAHSASDTIERMRRGISSI